MPPGQFIGLLIVLRLVENLSHANAGRGQIPRKVKRAEQDVPDRKQDREIAAAGKAWLGRQVEGVVPAVVARAHDEVVAQRPEAQPGIHEKTEQEISARNDVWGQQKLGLVLLWQALSTKANKQASP